MVLGPYKSEIWTNVGAVPFPFAPNQGVIVEEGCAAKFSAAKANLNLYWLSQGPEGARMVMQCRQNGEVKRISHHAIESEFLTYARVDDAVGNCYQIRGHAFYRLHFPTADRTWVYDQETSQWFEDSWDDNNGVAHRSRIGFSAFAYGKNVGLDWETGSLYLIDETNFSDNGVPIRCVRSFPHIIGQNNERVTIWRAMLDMELGNGPGIIQVPTTQTPWSLGFSAGFGPRVLVEPPEVSLRVSRTRGASWDDRRAISAGAGGIYNFVPTWLGLGMGRDFVLEFSWATPMKTAINGAFIEYIEVHEP